jgi:hypothetical protein
MVLSRNDMLVEYIPGILNRTINLPLGSKYTMWLDVGDSIARMARRFMLKSVPQQTWPISIVFVMVLVMTFTNTTSCLSKIVTCVFISGCVILPDGKLVFTDQEGKRLLMFSYYGNYEKDIVRFSGTPFEVNLLSC